MEPLVDLMACATPLPPLAACAEDGQVIVEAVPSFHALPAAATRYLEKLAVVPEESERTTREIGELGRLTPELSALIAGSSQVLIVPWKMPARAAGSSLRS